MQMSYLLVLSWNVFVVNKREHNYDILTHMQIEF